MQSEQTKQSVSFGINYACSTDQWWSDKPDEGKVGRRWAFSVEAKGQVAPVAARVRAGPAGVDGETLGRAARGAGAVAAPAGGLGTAANDTRFVSLGKTDE